MMQPTEIVRLNIALQESFRAVAGLILDNAGRVESVGKADGTRVTEIDVEVERLIVARLQPQFPGLIISGEEGGYSEEDLPEQILLIDPIDGTEAFIRGEQSFTTMAVLIENKQPILSFVYNPSSDDMYTAIRGAGAFHNGERMNLDQTSLPSAAHCKGRFIAGLDQILEPKKVATELGPNGAGFGFSAVASGLVAAKFCLPGKGYIHDYATGALLVIEAGGAIITTDNSEYNCASRSFVACHPDLAGVIRKNIAKIRELEVQQ
jgi:myo-inositol-1(or 4)-monophosphatase